jgi:hypothetical protein
MLNVNFNLILTAIPVLETVRNIFLSTILELYSEITLSRGPFGIGHMYIYMFLLRMTDTMTFRNIGLSSWDSLYTSSVSLKLFEVIKQK